jgi:hypothetical protein
VFLIMFTQFSCSLSNLLDGGAAMAAANSGGGVLGFWRARAGVLRGG